MNRENVWDYPRPPRLESVPLRLTVRFAGQLIADTTRGWRVLETSHPPTYYFPAEDIDRSVLVPVPRRTVCEFKGEARYFDLVLGDRRSPAAAWSYDRPAPRYADLAGAVAFYASRVDECRVGDWVVSPQAGDFYGGWITPNLDGPFKGGPGTRGW